MSLSPMVDNNVLSVSDNAGSTEIVAAQDDVSSEETKDWTQEEQTNNDEGDVSLSDSILSDVSMNSALSRDNNELV